jgi:uncharacterized cupredoxin-like copper-binding protein
MDTLSAYRECDVALGIVFSRHMRETMLNKKLIRYVLLALVVGLIAAACSSSDSTDTTMSADMEMDGGHEEFSFGEPAMATEATRVIEISANDDFTFDPDKIAVTEGEVITFKVTNDGKIPHDFVLGELAVQVEHEAEMQDMTGDDSMAHEEPNAFVIDPGETKEMTWHMTESGEIIMGCHQPGHYVAGMKGTIETSS